MTDESAPKLHIDSDWKAEAQAEKERLAEAEKKKEAEGDQPQPGQLPPADMKALIGMIAFQAISSLGANVDPQTGRAMVDPDGARFSIDLLSVLEEKTKGNLSEEESTELTQVLSQLRAQFVQIMQAIAQQQAAGVDMTPPAGGDIPLTP